MVPVAFNAPIITGGAGSPMIVKVALPVPTKLVALMVALKLPVVVGVPLMIPVVVSMLRPEGNPDAAKEVGLFVAVIW